MSDNENQGATVDRIIARATPTDDEREALALELIVPLAESNTRAAEHIGAGWSWRAEARSIADVILSAGFRRAEASEPSAGMMALREAATSSDTYMTPEQFDMAIRGLGGRPEAADDHECFTCGLGYGGHQGGCPNAALTEKGDEPQTEPSDAQVSKLANDAHHRMVDEAEAGGGWYGFSHSRDAWQNGFETGYRARATGEPQGEPSSEVPEPSGEHQKHADARRAETMTLLSHSEPQGEPSDAQAEEEANRRWPHTPGDPVTASARSARRLSFRQGVIWARSVAKTGGER